VISSAQLRAANAPAPVPEFPAVTHYADQVRSFPPSTYHASVKVIRLHQRLNEGAQLISGAHVAVFAARKVEPAGDVSPDDLAALDALADSIDLPESIQVSKLPEDDPRYQIW
jgi:hypothetical protein